MRNAVIFVALAFFVSAAVASVVPEEHAAGNTTRVDVPENVTLTKPVEPEPVKPEHVEQKPTAVNHGKHAETGNKKVHSKSKFMKSKDNKSKVNKTRSKKVSKTEKDHDAAPRSKRGVIMADFKCPTQIVVQGDRKICVPEGYNHFSMGSS